MDRAFAEPWDCARVEPAERAPELALLRRLSLTLTGTVLSPEEIRAAEGAGSQEHCNGGSRICWRTAAPAIIWRSGSRGPGWARSKGRSSAIGGLGSSKEPEKPVTVEDIHATIQHALGLNPEKEIVTPVGRPIALSDGKVIRELLRS